MYISVYADMYIVYGDGSIMMESLTFYYYDLFQPLRLFKGLENIKHTNWCFFHFDDNSKALGANGVLNLIYKA